MLKHTSLKNGALEPDLHLQIDYHQAGIQSVSFQRSPRRGIQWTFRSPVLNRDLEAGVTQWLESYRQKQHPSFQLPFDWSSLPLFTQQVLKAVAAIPFGTVLTYGQVATLIDRPQAARAVGGACGRNPFLLFIPCHRVLDAKHDLRGYSAGGISVKKTLLDFEEFPC